jgi:radical SAM superfamily enzyme YgiQ (UPF0313 family)
MKIELIVPMFKKDEARGRNRRARVFKLPPSGLLNVAAVTPDDVEVTLSDENVETLTFDKNPDLVGITIVTASAPRGYEIADMYRERGVPVVLGGAHVSYMHEEALEHADSIIIGEAEGAWEKLVEDFKRGGKEALHKTYKVDEKPDMANVPLPRIDLLQNSNYIGKRVMHVTRGCPHNCSFCTVTDTFGKKLRCRPVEQVVEFVKQNIGPSLRERFFMFFDDNIMAHREYAKRLFKALIPYRIIWMSQASINSAYDEELIELAAKSGCKGLFVGIETISKKALKEVGKSQNKVDFYKTAIKRFHKHGIFIEGAFIFGFDTDEKDVFERTVKFINMLKLDGIQYSILTPLPYTRFYKKIEDEDRFITKNWSEYDCASVVFQPKNMTPLELMAGMNWAYKRTYSFLSIFRRSTGVLQNIRRIKYYFFFLIFNFGHRFSCRQRFKSAWNPNRRNRKLRERILNMEEFSRLLEYEPKVGKTKLGYGRIGEQ